jgi:hypothetical protein
MEGRPRRLRFSSMSYGASDVRFAGVIIAAESPIE